MAPPDPEAAVRAAQAAFDRNDFMQAEQICRQALQRNGQSAKLHFLLYRVYATTQREADAVKHAQRAIDLMPRYVPFRLALGTYHARSGRYELAVKTLRRARSLAPDDVHVIAALADALQFSGQKQEAHDLLKPIIDQGSEDPLIAAIWGRVAIDRKEPHEALRVMTRHVSAADLSQGFLFTLGEAFEKAGIIDESFAAYSRANAASRTGFDLDRFADQHRRLAQVFDRSFTRRAPKPTHATDTPIFIAGRPRSGTTLIEKILDAHPDVAGVSELPMLTRQIAEMNLAIGSTLPYPDCARDLDQNDVNLLSQRYLDELRRLAPKARRIVDKHLSNYEHLGLISILFPQSRVLHIRRNIVDNCWACFVANINKEWTYTLRSTAITYRIYERLMRHWHEQLDLPILDIDYEAVVEDQEGWTRKILEFCGLEFDERCLRFYEESAAPKKQDLGAVTLSYDQVRQPIYKTSVGRAARFEKHLTDLHEGLEEGKAIAEALFDGIGPGTT